MSVSGDVDIDQVVLDKIARRIHGGAAVIQGIYHLSPMQEGMLFHHLLNERTDTYVISTVIECDCHVQVEAVVWAVQQVIDRHDALRSAVLWEGLPKPVQIVFRRAQLMPEQLGDSTERMNEIAAAVQQKWDLRRAPLVRLAVPTNRGTGPWCAVLSVHHLMCDHQSLGVLLAETREFLAGRGHCLPRPRAYREYVRDALQRADGSNAADFFRAKLRGISEPTAPFGLLGVHGDGRRIKSASRTLDPSLVRRLRLQSRVHEMSVARIFHAIWALVVARTSGRSDVVFGTVVLAQTHRDGDAGRMLGMAVNTLPLRVNLGGLTAQGLIETTDREITDILQFEEASLALTQRCSQINGEAPLFTSLLNYRHAVRESHDAENGGGIRIRSTNPGVTNYPLAVRVDDLGEGISVTVDTDAVLTPDRISGYVQTALESLVSALEEAPQTPASMLAILPEEERRKILEEFNDTVRPFPEGKRIHELFEEQVQRTPEAVAVIHESHMLTYAALNAQANQLARYLRKRQIGPDYLVGVCVERGLSMVVGLLGILKAGGAYVPLDPSYPAERLQYVLDDAAPSMLLTQTRLRDRLPRTNAEVIVLDEQWSEIAQQPRGDLAPGAVGLRSDHLAYVIYTSGSTGHPKGVAIEHRNAVNLICWARSAMPAEIFARTLYSTSLNFDLSVYECFVPLAMGASIQVVENAMELLRSRLDVTLINTVPAAIRGIAESGHIPATTRGVNLAGEPLKKDVVDLIFQSSTVDYVCNLYGPSETTTYSSWVSMSRRAGFLPTIGRPVANTRFYILDPSRQLVPIGVTGEIYIGGAGVARGYLNRPELTAERFIKDPFSADPWARLYKTGDLGRWCADGKIEYLGRNDTQVKLRGFRIELGEIEAQLARHEEVRESAVVMCEDVIEDGRLVAYLVPRNPSVTAGVLRGYLQRFLPEYMVPSAFVMLERLPLTPSGKLDRRSLPVPDLSAYVSGKFEAPQGEIEATLAGIWRDVLHVERVGRHDNFFELGGHSLKMMKMMVAISETFPIRITISDALKNPSIAALARAMNTLRMTTAAEPGADSVESEEIIL